MDIIPTKDARLALDIVASTLERNVGENIGMNDNPDYIRVSLLYRICGIHGTFSDLILGSLLNEGRRKMYSRQPYHVRLVASKNKDSLVYHGHTSEEE